MGIYINTGNIGFQRVRNSEYVDKSRLISVVNSTLFTERCFTCVTRCRRFGKSIAAKMLCAYYDHSCDSRQLFADLQIASDPQFEKHLNKYPVIYLDISDFVTRFKDESIMLHINEELKADIHEAYPDLVVLYVTGNEFKTQYVNAVNVQNKLADFMAFYMRIDVLIVDDIQELVGPASQNAFFNIFNHLHQSGKQLVFTSDRAPVDLLNFEERLLSRFKWGLSVELQKPDRDTRLAMLKARCFREGVSVPDDVLEMLAGKVRSNFRELEGALISLIANATLCHEPITRELAERVTGNIVGEEKQEVTIDKVKEVVCEYFNITGETLLSKSRKRQIVQARQIAMYMSRNLIGGCSLSTIGMELGGKDHATVLHACTTVSDLMSTDKMFRQYVTDIEKMLVPVAR